MLTMILPPVPGSSTVAGYMLITYPATAMRAPRHGPRGEVPHVGVDARAGLPMLDARRAPTWRTVPGVPLTAAVWRGGRLAAARP